MRVCNRMGRDRLSENNWCDRCETTCVIASTFAISSVQHTVRLLRPLSGSSRYLVALLLIRYFLHVDRIALLVHQCIEHPIWQLI